MRFQVTVQLLSILETRQLSSKHDAFVLVEAGAL